MALFCAEKLTATVKLSRAIYLASKYSICSVTYRDTVVKDYSDQTPRLVRSFHSTVSSNAKYIKGKKYKWTDIPQPELKPIGPEDYNRWKYYINQPAVRIPELTQLENSEEISQEIFEKVNTQIASQSYGRLFAVVHIAGKQFKISTEDLIVIQGHFHPAIGETIRLRKVLLLGSSDFTLIGKPLLNKDMMNIEATVIEKTLSHIMPHFTFIKRAHHRRLNFYRIPFTVLRINCIELREQVDELSDVEGVKDEIVT